MLILKLVAGYWGNCRLHLSECCGSLWDSVVTWAIVAMLSSLLRIRYFWQV